MVHNICLLPEEENYPLFLSPLNLPFCLVAAATSISFVVTRVLLRQSYAFRNKSKLVMTKLLSQQNCLSWQNIFVAAKLLSGQTHVCHNKHTFVMTKDVFCHDKHMFVATKESLLRQNFSHNKIMFVMTKIFLSQQRFCCDKHTFVTTKDVFCCDKHMFVMTNMCLSRQKLYLWQLPPMIPFHSTHELFWCFNDELVSAKLCMCMMYGFDVFTLWVEKLYV